MTSTPSYIVVTVLDSQKLSIPTAFVLIKNLFQFGVRDIKIHNNNQILLSLGYCPKESTLIKKFGNLPVRFERINLENMDDYSTVQELRKRYKFNLSNDEATSLGLLALPNSNTQSFQQQQQYLKAMTMMLTPPSTTSSIPIFMPESSDEYDGKDSGLEAQTPEEDNDVDDVVIQKINKRKRINKTK